MPENSDLTLQGDLDNQLVLKSIKEMEEAADKMARSGDESFQRIARAVEANVKALKTNQQELEAGRKTYSVLFSDGQIGLEEFRKGITKLAADVKRVAAESGDAWGDVNLSGIFEGLDRVDLADLIQTGTLLQRIDELQALITRLKNSTSESAREMGAALEANFNILEKGGRSADEYEKELKDLTASAKEFVRGLDSVKETDLAQALKADIAKRQLDQIKDSATNLASSSNDAFAELGQNVSDRAAEIEDFYRRGQANANEYAAAVTALGSQLRQALILEGDETKPFDEALALNEAIDRVTQLDELISRLSNTINSGAVDAADNLRDKLAILNEQFSEKIIGPEELNKQLRSMITNAEQAVDRFKEFEELDVEEALNLIEAKQALDAVRTTANELFDSTDKEAKKAGDQLLKNADLLEDQYKRGVKGADQYYKKVGELEKQANRLSKRFDDVVKVDFTKGTNVDVFRARLIRVDQVVKDLTNNTSTYAQEAGQRIEQAALKMIDAFSRGKISADELNSGLKNLENRGKELSRTYGDDVEEATKRSTVSIWKMGNALDRVGVRGAGGMLRVVDAVKSMNPAIIAVILGMAGVLIAVKKITEAVIDLSKKAAKAFADLIKDSVELAAQYETVELQLRNIFHGKVELAKQMVDRIAELSAKLGVDLSGRIAATFLPLVESFAQFEQIGEIAATLAVKTGKSVDEVSRALQQGVAGQFRSLQYQFAVTGDWIDLIKEKQETLGDTEGLIAGLEAYFEATGTGWNTYQDTLRRVRGQLEQTFSLFKKELGEPIKIALTDQLRGIGEWIEDNKETIKRFFREIGEAVSTVVEGIGNLVNKAIRDIDQQDLEDIATKAQEIADNIKNFLDSLTDADFSVILDGLLLALDIVNELITQTQNWIATFRAGAAGIGIEQLSDLKRYGRAAAAGGPLGVIAELTQQGAASIIKYATGQPSGIDVGAQIVAERKDEIQALKDLRAEHEKLREERKKAAEEGKKGAEEESDAYLKLNVLTQERADLLTKVTEAAQEISAEIAEFNVEMERAFRDIFVEEARRDLDMHIENARKRLDLERKHGIALRDIYEKDRIARREQLIDAGDESEDISIEYHRKLEDIDLEENKKKEENLEKHLNRLKEIREKFDLDAEEAIRQNDAVALLRIRRRMALELRQENRRYEESVEQAEAAAEDKREKLDTWLRREEEDLDRSNARKLRDIKRRLDDEVAAEKQKYQDLLDQQAIEEKRKRDDLKKWLDREVEDFNQMWVDKKEDLSRNMEDTIDIYERGVDRLIEINDEMAQLMAQGLSDAAAYLGNLGELIPRIEGGELLGLGESNFGIGNRLPGENPNQASMQQLISLALSLAQQLGRLDELTPVIESSTYAELVRIIEGLQDDVRRLGPGRAGGGIISPGVTYVGGEFGAEPIFPMQHGIVAPHDPIMLSPQSQQYANFSTDNSRNITADISLLDPTQLSEVQKTLIRSIFTEELLRLGD